MTSGHAHRRNGLQFVLILCVLVGFLSACTNQSTTTPTSNSSAIKIGGTVSSTGDFSHDGPALKQGYELWANTINKRGGLLGHPITLDILDDGSKPEQVTASYTKLITVDKVNLLFAPFSGALTVPAALVAQRYGYPLIEGAATEKDTFEHGLTNLYAVSLSATRYLSTFVSYIESLPFNMRPKTVSYATSNDTFTQPQVQPVKSAFEKAGITTSTYTEYAPETTDFTPIAQKLVRANAQVVVLGTLGVQDLSAFLSYFRQQHYNPQAIVATSGPDQGQSYLDALSKDSALAQKLAEGTIVPNDGWYPGRKTFQNGQFTADYIAAFHGTADGISSDTVQAYAVGQVLEQATTAAKSVDKKMIWDVLKKGLTFNSIQGIVRFDTTGQNSSATPFLFQWQKGNLIPVYPSTEATQNVEFPKPKWP